MNFEQRTIPNILCCICGAVIPANPSNMCVNCVRNQVDITDGISKNLILQFCRGCERYLQPPALWVVAELESRQLLALCLKRVKGMNKVRLIDAGFVWTEPHSRRLKVKLSIQKEVLNGTILQQSFICEFVVQHLMCPDCHQTEAKLTWKAVAQVRQKVDHKRTFYWLEQLILKHNAHNHCLNIKEMHDGIDFFFANKTHAQKFVDFVATVTPIRQKTSKELISHDVHEDTYNYKFTISVEIAPPCKDDLVCLPRGLANSLGNISPLLLCVKMSTSLHFLNPFTLQYVELTANNYWKNPFRAIASRDRLMKFVILDVNPLGPSFHKFVLAEVVLARESDFGRNDVQFTAVTHLGHLLKPGDFALGYDLTRMNFNDADISSLRNLSLPDILLVRKDYQSQNQKRKRRKWRLNYLPKEEEESKRKHDADRAAKEQEEFMQDLEEDPELWQQVNLFRENRDGSSSGSDVSDSEDPEFPGPRLNDLITDIQKLSIHDMDVEDD